jgi:radical SAM protein with 4Fe4S-binding SPASM domain
VLGNRIEEFIHCYVEALEYIIGLNLRGTFFTEHNATMLLGRMMTPFSDGFMDLQFPSGAGLCGVIYDYNGDVYPCDEARMLARHGDKKFRMGNVHTDSARNICDSVILHEIVDKSCAEIIPACSDCVYQLYCGADPIRNYTLYGDLIGEGPGSDHCKKHMALFDYLFGLVRSNKDDVMNVLWSWVTRRPLREVSLSSC